MQRRAGAMVAVVYCPCPGRRGRRTLAAGPWEVRNVGSGLVAGCSGGRREGRRSLTCSSTFGEGLRICLRVARVPESLEMCAEEETDLLIRRDSMVLLVWFAWLKGDCHRARAN